VTHTRIFCPKHFPSSLAASDYAQKYRRRRRILFEIGELLEVCLIREVTLSLNTGVPARLVLYSFALYTGLL
jgi:hypothetical protein